MTGKILVALIFVAALAAGGGMYYLQVYAFYEPVAEEDVEIALMPLGEETAPEPIPYDTFEGIDANSSPLRFRACFHTDLTLAEATDRFTTYPEAAPRVAPRWFGCFDAEAIGEMIEDGRATVFLSERNIAYGIDRVVALTEEGFGYVWQEVNDCGETTYDGTPLGEDCPPPPEN